MLTPAALRCVLAVAAAERLERRGLSVHCSSEGGNNGPAKWRARPMTKEVRLLSTSAILGYGFPETSLRAGLERQPHAIGVDGGSVDPGPHYLGSGKPFCSPIAIRRDLRLMLNAAR